MQPYPITLSQVRSAHRRADGGRAACLHVGDEAEDLAEVTHLEQQAVDLQQQLDESDEDLAAARATNRELMARLNAPSLKR
jgi:hypothetical protein